FPLIFLVIFGGLFKSSGIPKSSVILVGSVPLIQQVPQDGLDQVLKISKSDDLAGSITKVRDGDAAAAIEQHGDQLVVHYSQADPTAAGTVRGVIESLVQSANLAATGQPPRFSVQAEEGEDRALKPIQYFTPGILGYAIAIGATFGAAATLVTWRQKKILRRLTLSPVRITSVIGARIVVAFVIALVQ